MGLPCDLSGSRSKNRFRLELLWGISRMLELMESANDFTIVFDLVCDICKSQYKNVGLGQYKNVGFPTFLYCLFSLHLL